MPRHDDATIPDEAILIRAVRPDWVVTDNNGERLSSGTFVDGAEEASCFIEEEVGGLEDFRRDILPELSAELGSEFRVATVAVSRVRAKGLWVYRKPEEFKNNPAHVVVCAAIGMSRSSYKRSARKLAEDAHLL